VPLVGGGALMQAGVLLGKEAFLIWTEILDEVSVRFD